MIKLLFLFILFSVIGLKAQNQSDSLASNTNIKIKNFVLTYYRPVLNDTSLLFFNNSVMCDCRYENQSHESLLIPINKVDFKKVSMCTFKEKVFIQCKNSTFGEPRYKFKSARVVGELIRMKNNNFEYREYDKQNRIVRKEKLNFIFNEVIENLTHRYYDRCFNGFEEKIIYFKTIKVK